MTPNLTTGYNTPMSKEHRTLLVDVGSANVGVCIAETKKDGEPVVSHVRRTPLENVSGRHTAAIASLAIGALKKSLTALGTVSPVPETAHIVLAAPWYRARIKSISTQSNTTIRIAQSAVEKALAEYKSKHAESASSGVRQIESTVSQIYVNGYQTELLKPVHGKALSVSLYESEADGPFVSALEGAVRATFHGVRVTFHSFPFALFAVLRALKESQSFIALDVGGEITDVVVVNRGSLSFIGSFPSGTLSLLRAVAGKGSSADTASRLSLYARGELSPEEDTAFGALFTKVAAFWTTGYHELLENASLTTPLPNTIFIVADKEELRWFEKVLQGAGGAFPVRPVPVTPDFFQNSVALGEEGSYDAFLSIEALYALRIKK